MKRKGWRPTSQLILQHLRSFTYLTAHSPTIPWLYLRHSSFSNPSVASPTSQVILKPFRRFTYATAHSPTFNSLLLRHRLNLKLVRHFTYVTAQSSFSNLSVASPTSQLILQPFFHFFYVTSSAHYPNFPSFTYVTAHSPTVPSLYLRHSSFSNSSVALPMSQLILQLFFRFSHVTGSSLTSPGEPPMIIPTLITKFLQNIVADTDRNKRLEFATEQVGKLRYVTAVEGRLKRFPWVAWFAHPWSRPTAKLRFLHELRLRRTNIKYPSQLDNDMNHGRLARWRELKSCDVGEAKEGLANELWRRSSNGRVGEWTVT